MKKNILFGTMMLLAGSLIAADGAKDEVMAAAKKLADKANYSWKSTIDNGPNSQFGPNTSEGKTEKDGITWLSTTFGENTSEGVMKAGKVAVKTDEGWRTAEELTGGGGGGGGGGNPGMFAARRLQSLKAPAAEVEDLISKTKDLKKEGEAYVGEMTEDGAKALIVASGFGRRGGGQATASNAKGTVKFWVKDGVIAKYESKVTGKRINQNGDERDVDRTTTIEIKDVGTTKLTVPDEAKKKLS